MPIGNLENCKIYKIVSLSNNELAYYGHTTQTLANRFSVHKHKSNLTKSKSIIEKGDAVILLVENYPCESEIQARDREAYYIINNICVNKNIPNRTHSESMKNWQVNHKDHWNEYQRKYAKNRYEKNKLALLNRTNNAIQQIDQQI